MELPRPSEETFGTGKFVSEINDPDFFEMSPEDQARFLGQRAGCPVVEELIAPKENGGRGAEAMQERYGNVNFWYDYIDKEIKSLNEPLHNEFSTPKAREKDKDGCPLIGHRVEPHSVPDNYSETMAPINALPNFSVPRILIDQLPYPKPVDNKEKAANQDALAETLTVLRNSIKKSQTSSELMARFSEKLSHTGTRPEELLKHILGQGWMDEHNALAMLEEGKTALKEFAPTVWKYYEKLTPEERKEKGLVIL